jgi:hypothetical protein
LVVATAPARLRWIYDIGFILLGSSATFLSGSRQGLVRILVFFAFFFGNRPRRLGAALVLLLTGGAAALALMEQPRLAQNEVTAAAVERQQVLIEDPLSNEGLSGRPELWESALQTLNQEPLRWLVGYGMGNYAEFRNAAHSMPLQLLQDGGLLHLVGFGILWGRIFFRIWRRRKLAWPLVAVTAALLSSSLTSGVFYPNLATGWYLGLYFVMLHAIPRWTKLPIPAPARRLAAHRLMSSGNWLCALPLFKPRATSNTQVSSWGLRRLLRSPRSSYSSDGGLNRSSPMSDWWRASAGGQDTPAIG